MFRSFGIEYIFHLDSININVKKVAEQQKWLINDNNIIIFDKTQLDKYVLYNELSCEYNEYVKNYHHCGHANLKWHHVLLYSYYLKHNENLMIQLLNNKIYSTFEQSLYEIIKSDTYLKTIINLDDNLTRIILNKIDSKKISNARQHLLCSGTILDEGFRLN